MTKQEIIAEINAKIAGQGTNIDAGSALPGILQGILDLIPDGALTTSPQELTEGQQEQVLENLALTDVLRSSEQSLTDTQKAQAQNNIGLSYLDGVVVKLNIPWQNDYAEIDEALYNKILDTPIVGVNDPYLLNRVVYLPIMGALTQSQQDDLASVFRNLLGDYPTFFGNAVFTSDGVDGGRIFACAEDDGKYIVRIADF